MIRITITVDKPVGQAIGIKEDIAMCLERFGDARVTKIEEVGAEQLQFARQTKKTGG